VPPQGAEHSQEEILADCDLTSECSGSSRHREQPFLEENIMNTTIAVTKEVTTVINILTVEPENQPKLTELLRGNTKNVVSRLDGWISNSYIAA
jgi:hypothetical protein